MALLALASLEDLEARLSVDIANPVRAAALLTDASAAIRAYTGQEITERVSTARLRCQNANRYADPGWRGKVVRLPQQPVSAVSAVNDVNGNGVIFFWSGGQLVEFGSAPIANISGWWLSRLLWVDVTYTHGYAEVPDEIVAIACQIAGRAYGTPVDMSGMQQEGIGSYHYRIGPAAAAGGMGLLAAERGVLDRYRLPVQPALSI